MNNSLVWILVGSLLLVSVTGCIQSADVSSEEMVIETYTGVLTELPDATKHLFDTTHSFEDETGNIIYVRSLIYDLYDQLYNDALIRVNGVPRNVEGRKTLTIDKIEVVEENISKNEIKFDKHTNQKLGLSLDVPTTGELNETSSKIEIANLPGTITLSVVDSADLIKVNKDLESAVAIKVGVDAVDGYEMDNIPMGEAFRYYIKRNDETYYLVSYKQNGDVATDRNLAEEIVNSLRFVPFAEENVEMVKEEVVAKPEIVPVENNVVTVTNDPIDPKILENFRALESLPLEFTAYYPKSWYYAQVENGYAFALDSVTDDNWVAYINVGKTLNVELKKDWVQMSKDVGGKSFVIYGAADLTSKLEVILKTLTLLNN